MEFYDGASFADRIGEITAIQTGGPAVPKVDLGNVMSAVRWPSNINPGMICSAIDESR